MAIRPRIDVDDVLMDELDNWRSAQAVIAPLKIRDTIVSRSSDAPQSGK